MPKLKDLSGQRFGRLTPTTYDKESGKWRCSCRCGNETYQTPQSLVSGIVKSCGCYNRDKNRAFARLRTKNLPGTRFGRLVVLHPLPVREKHGQRIRYWRCKCDCGSKISVPTNRLRSGNTKSCGCLRRERVSAAVKMRIGSRHPNWNPEKSMEERITKRFSTGSCISYAALKNRIRRRDGNRCVACGLIRRGHHVHHILPWFNQPQLRATPANLLTLCPTCHKDFHALYGFDCDLDDLEEYLKN